LSESKKTKAKEVISQSEDHINQDVVINVHIKAHVAKGKIAEQ
jgi:hypothetical protein